MDGLWGTEEVVICVAIGHFHFSSLGCCDAIVGEEMKISLWLSICGRGSRVVLASVITVPLSAVFSSYYLVLDGRGSSSDIMNYT